MADTDDDVLFQSTVEHENKPHILLLTKCQLSWELHSKCKLQDENILESVGNNDACVDLREVIGIKPIKIPPKQSTLGLKKKYKLKNDTPVCIEMQPLGPVGFSVYVVQRTTNSKWRYRQISFQCKDSNICQQWICVLKDALKAPEFNRPRNVIVFVNPYSGKKRAPKIYKDKVLPLLELADISIQTIETERQNHAKDLVENSLDLQNVDGLICIGGDGIFSELLNGLLNRTLKEANIPQTCDHQPISPDIRIGIIPAGSTDTIVYTTNGVGDPVTSTLHIILGDSVGIDVNSVNVNGQFDRYSVTVCGYGYLGDLMKDSENKRWMGPRRYDWSGTKTFLLNRAYSGELKFRLSENTDSHPFDKVRCYSGCETCNMSSPSSQSTDVSAGRDTDSIEIETDTSDHWKTIQGKFTAVNAVTMSCSCDLSPKGLSPYSHLGDGCLDLLLIPACSRLDFLRCLIRTARGEHIGLPQITMYRVKEFSFRPLSDVEIDNENGDSGTSESKTDDKNDDSSTSISKTDNDIDESGTSKSKTDREIDDSGTSNEKGNENDDSGRTDSKTYNDNDDLGTSNTKTDNEIDDSGTSNEKIDNEIDDSGTSNEKTDNEIDDSDNSKSKADNEKEDSGTSKSKKKSKAAVRHSVWNCDGELIRDPRINLRVHRQLVKLFARGLENIDTPSEKSDGTRSNCCKSSEKAD